MDSRLLSISDLAETGRTGDVLLFRRRSLISRYGRGIHSHAAMIVFIAGLPMVAEIREWIGGRAITLKSELRRRPGAIDYYRVEPPNYDRLKASMAMLRKCGNGYNYWGVIGAAMLRLPIVNRWIRLELDDAISVDPWGPQFCSQAVASALRAGGVDAVHNLADKQTEPADLARSTALNFLGTLTL